MTQKNKLLETPPFAVEKAIKRLGMDIKVARLRRNLTIQDVAGKIGAGIRAVSDAEKGKLSTSIAVYVALLWVLDLLPQLDEVATPENDKEGLALSLLKGKEKAGKKGILDNDF